MLCNALAFSSRSSYGIGATAQIEQYKFQDLHRYQLIQDLCLQLQVELQQRQVQSGYAKEKMTDNISLMHETVKRIDRDMTASEQKERDAEVLAYAQKASRT
jgi:hypothetical protein